MNLSRAAQWYASNGFHVLPLRGKVPLTLNGVKGASDSPERVAAWWEESPWANIGVACGASGIVVIDIDPRNGGHDTWKAFPRTETVTSKTGGGGVHYWFKEPGVSVRWPRTIGEGVDVQAGSKYIVVPPSETEKRYIFLRKPTEYPIADCPEWLLERRDASPVSTYVSPVVEDPRDAWLIGQMGLVHRKGEWWGKCPVHEERNPSFSVSFREGVRCFHCLGCGYKGTVTQLLKAVTIGDFR